MATERQILGQAQRILVDATNQIWHKISLWTHVSDVEMQDGTPLNEFLTDMSDDLNERIDGKYNSYNLVTTNIANLSQIPEVGYSRIKTTIDITAGDYTILANHYCYCYSGKDPNSIEKMAVMIDTTDLTSIVMYIAHYSIEARWTLTKIATQKQIDSLQDQINNLNAEFNRLNLFVESSIGNLNARYQIIQNQMDWLEAELAELQEFLNDLLNELRDFKRAINGRVDEIDKIFKALYGSVGSLYITTSHTVNGKKLEELFGGKWKLVQGAYLYAGCLGTEVYHGGFQENYVYLPSAANGARKYTRSEVGGNYDVIQSTGSDINFESIFTGRESFTINESNMPEHRHKVNEEPFKKGVGITYRVRGDYDSFSGDAWADINIASGDSEYCVVGIKKSVLGNPGRPGVGFIEPATGPNESPNEPVLLDPIRFKVFVWCRYE